MTRQEVFDWTRKEYGTEPEYLWADSPNSAVLRNKDNKWYGIIMDVPRNRFGIDSDEIVDVLNVKIDLMMLELLLKEPGFYRAYHMNKRHWISIFLDGSAPEDIIKNLLADSYAMTSKRTK